VALSTPHCVLKIDRYKGKKPVRYKTLTSVAIAIAVIAALTIRLRQAERESMDLPINPTARSAVRNAQQDPTLSKLRIMSIATMASAAPVPRPNHGSVFGTNIGGINYYNGNHVFIDAFKASGDWVSNTSDEVDTDQYGYVRSLKPSQTVTTNIPLGDRVTGMGSKWILIYSGQGELRLPANQATITNTAPGRIEFVANDKNLVLRILATDPQNHLRDIHVVPAGGVCKNKPFVPVDSASRCNGSQYSEFSETYETLVFNPVFLDTLKTYRVLRFMETAKTNNSTISQWADRPRVTDARWSSERGAPLEVMIQLANRMNADAWLNVPHLADDDYVAAMASLVKARSKDNIRIYIEHSNEVFNANFTQYRYAEEKGLQLGLSTVKLDAAMLYHGKRSLEIFKIFERAISAQRLVRVLVAQRQVHTASKALSYPETAAHTDAIGFAPYLRISKSATDPTSLIIDTEAEANEVIGMSMDQVFARMRKNFDQIRGHLDDYARLAAQNNFRFITYEGGQELAAVRPPTRQPPLPPLPNQVENTALTQKLNMINRDPRMKSLYADYLNLWRSKSSDLFMHFLHLGAYSKHGSWGSLEYLNQPQSNAPKYEALQQFIEENRRTYEWNRELDAI
jgi:hypothetical protein